MVTSLKGNKLLPEREREREREREGANSFLSEKSVVVWDNNISTKGDPS